MTRLGEEIKRLEADKSAWIAEAGKEMTAVARVVVDELSELFECALDTDKLSNESELVKLTALRSPATVCVIDNTGATLRINLTRYKEGQLKNLDDHMRAVFLNIVATLMSEKYPEYVIRRNGGDIRITEHPPAPLSFIQWVRSLFKPRELV